VKDTSGPAFPLSVDRELGSEKGLTKREWFAGLALLGIMAMNKNPSLKMSEIVSDSYKMADAMIAEGDKS